MLFEDNPNSPISELLRKSSYGKYMHFSCGNWKIVSKCMDILNMENVTKVYIFVDCSPNNVEVRRIYSSIFAEIGHREDVEIFPIVCIEEVVLDMLKNYYEVPYFDSIKSLVENIVFKFDWMNVDDNLRSIPYVSESIEHAYKYVLSHLKTKCLYNENSESEGKFYRADCSCDRKICKVLDCTDKLQVKAEKLYVSLPIFIKESDGVQELWNECGIADKESDVASVKQKLRDKFRVICDSLGVAEVTI
jgi:hypothetical protein